MKKTIEAFVQKEQMIEPGDAVMAAFSGGADSVFLLYLLAVLWENWKLRLVAVHVNHGLRGAEAQRDEEFAKAFCRRLGVACIVCSVDVRTYVKEQGVSLEEGCRILRCRALEQQAGRWAAECGRPVKIATAHHGDDQAETVLHHLFRGSGLKGMSGILPVRGPYIRPLLVVDKGQITAFLRSRGIGWCEDSTNSQNDYTRNRLRNRIIPLVKQDINLKAAQHICQAADKLRQADDYLAGQAEQWLAENAFFSLDYASVREKGYMFSFPPQAGVGIGIGTFKQLPEILQSYVIRQATARLLAGRKDISAVHIEAVEQLFERPGEKCISLPHGVSVKKTSGFVWMSRAKSPAAGADGRAGAPKLEYKRLIREKNQEIPQNQYTKWFDCDKIKGTLSVRTRQEGDYFLLPGGKRKTVKTFFIDEKIPAELRERIWLLADGHHIIWIIGRRISEGVKITPQTKDILQVHIQTALSGGKLND